MSATLQSRLRRIRRELDECAEQVGRLAEDLPEPAPAYPPVTLAPGSEIVGTAEVADIAGVTTNTVRVWKSRGLMPAPLAELQSTTVWLKADIERWAKERAR